MRTIRETAAAILAPRKGMLVLDEYAEELLADSRQNATGACAFAGLVLRTAELREHISAVLLTAPTFAGASSARGAGGPAAATPLVGVRVPVPRSRSDLHAKLGALAGDGAAFVEWRANLAPADVPRGAPHIEAEALARAALAAQAEGLLPVVTVAMPDLGASSIAVSQAVTTNALVALREQLGRLDVDPTGMLVRVNMVVPGLAHPAGAEPAQVARTTLRTLSAGLPQDTPGVLLLSGGQPLEQACENLQAITGRAAEQGVSWRVSHAFSRAIVAPAATAFRRQGPDDAGRELVAACRRAGDALDPVSLRQGAAS